MPDAIVSTELPPLTPATLYLVATPIGNREDITLRAIRVLRECDAILAEDTRHTGLFLHHLGIRKPMVSYFRFNEAQRKGEILDRLRNGEKLALVSDAGSPGISDPGQRLVAAARETGIRVEPVPGPCALIAALTSSGLTTDEFHFCGFLPHKSGQRRNRLRELLRLPGTLVLYESPFRLERLIQEFEENAPRRRIVISREITKRFEEWISGMPKDLLASLKERPRKGEFVVMIEPHSDVSSPDEVVDGEFEGLTNDGGEIDPIQPFVRRSVD